LTGSEVAVGPELDGAVALEGKRLARDHDQLGSGQRRRLAQSPAQL
jgi:hypothetical protein